MSGGGIRFVSYNILSRTLARQSYYPKCSRSALKSSSRLEKVKRKLDEHCSKDARAIIALQEVSLSWTGDLHVWFKKRGYTFVCSNYGSHFSDFMGCALAIPDDLYFVEEISIVKPTEHAQRWTFASSAPGTWTEIASSWFGWLWTKSAGTDRKRERSDALKNVPRRNNRMVMARLTTRVNDKRKTFCVATYHMPCVFWDERAMVCHAALSMRCAESFAKQKPFVYLGDFNIQPGSPGYEMLTKGGSFARDESNEGNPFRRGLVVPKEGQDDLQWASFARKLKPLCSAYAAASPSGKEPDMTNHTFSGNPPSYFSGCIDYIFTSPDGSWKVNETIPLPALERGDGSSPLAPEICPNAQEPSDHYLIGAELNVAA